MRRISVKNHYRSQMAPQPVRDHAFVDKVIQPGKYKLENYVIF